MSLGERWAGRQPTETAIVTSASTSPSPAANFVTARGPPVLGSWTVFPCSLSSILSMNCKSRAEAFARSLQSKLRTLGVNGDEQEVADLPETVGENENGIYTEQPKASLHGRHVTLGLESNSGKLLYVRQDGENGDAKESRHDDSGEETSRQSSALPRYTPDSDSYYDFDIASPLSPTELGEPNYPVINNSDDLTLLMREGEDGVEISLRKAEVESPSSQQTESGCVFSTPEVERHYQNLDSETSLLSDGSETSDSASSQYFDPEGEVESGRLQNGQLSPKDGDFVPVYLAEDSVKFMLNACEFGSHCCAEEHSNGCSWRDNSFFRNGEEVSTENHDIPNHREEPGIKRDEPSKDAIVGTAAFETASEVMVVPQILEAKDVPQILEPKDVPQIPEAEDEAQILEPNESSQILEPNEPPQIPKGEDHSTEEESAEGSAEREKRETSSSPENAKDRESGLRRCASLKSGKTPPGTPGRKKIVRFADALGLDLEEFRTFLDEIPNVPSSAYQDLDEAVRVDQRSDLGVSFPHVITTRFTNSPIFPSATVATQPILPSYILLPLFQQPGGFPDFLDRVRENKVSLENALEREMAIEGTVRVLNIDFHKSVFIRYSVDEWRTFRDLHASYVLGSCDGFSDKFSFTIYAHWLQEGQRVQFSVCYQSMGQQFWDSNFGQNYTFQCYAGPGMQQQQQPPLPPPPTNDIVESWTGAFH